MSNGNGVTSGLALQPIGRIELPPKGEAPRRKRGRPSNAELAARAPDATTLTEPVRTKRKYTRRTASEAVVPTVRATPRVKRPYNRRVQTELPGVEAPQEQVASDQVMPIPEHAPEAPQPDVAPEPTPATAQHPPAPTSLWFQVLPDIETTDDGEWEEVPSTMFYSSEANQFRTVAGLAVARVPWGGGIEAFMLRPRDPMTVRLNDGTIFDVPPKASFVAVPAIAELAAVLTKMEERPESALAVKFKPRVIKMIEDGRITINYRVLMRWVDIKRAEALVVS